MIAVSGQDMKAIDYYTINTIGIPGIVLMENAAEAFTQELLKEPCMEAVSTFIFCGLGNNGGDGFAIARKLNQKNIKVKVVVMGDPLKLKGDAKINYDILGQLDIEILCINSAQDIDSVFKEIPEGAIFVDAIFGIGCEKIIEGCTAEVIEKMNGSNHRIYAVDMPSGIHAHHGSVMGVAIKAYKTITFCLPKIGLFLYPGAAFTGDVVVVDIGIPEKVWYNQHNAFEIIDGSYQQLLPKRQVVSHKGSFGKVLIIAGSAHMMGAAILAAKAAYKAGCGIVKILTEAGYESTLFSALPEAIIETYSRDASFNEAMIVNAIQWSDAVLIGPGMTDDSFTEAILYLVLKQAGKKTVIDADGLNVLSRHLDWLENNAANIIVTPHIGEMSRLTGYDNARILENTVAFSLAFSQKHGVVTVLKSARTIITENDQVFINTLGNNGMATAGSGDVLAGIMVSLLAQTQKTLKSAVLGVFLHSRAGDVQALELGEAALMASDIIDGISLVMR